MEVPTKTCMAICGVGFWYGNSKAKKKTWQACAYDSKKGLMRHEY